MQVIRMIDIMNICIYLFMELKGKMINYIFEVLLVLMKIKEVCI